MNDFLSYEFIDSSNFINTFDEAPLWSSRFGFLLLDNIKLKPNLTVIDLGSGTGFPLLEIAERLGNSSKIYGIDPWENANKKAKQKIKEYNLSNVEIVEQSAEKLPFKEKSVDLIVSNLGINNFKNKELILQECLRVLKINGKLAITTNLYGHWKEFYSIFESTLHECKYPYLIDNLHQEQIQRGTKENISKLFVNQGFSITNSIESQFTMNFLNGTAFLNHHFIKCGWLSSWFSLFPDSAIPKIFKKLEYNLNIYAEEHKQISLSIPLLFLEGKKL